MKQLFIQLDAISPLAIRSDHAAGGTDAAKYIAGNTLLGSLAAVYRRVHPERTDDFEKLFLGESVLYPNLYPAVFNDEGLHNSNLPVYPLPKTAQSCKRHPGFLSSEDEEHDGHGVRDSLIDWTLFKEYQQTDTKSLAALRHYKTCHYKIHENDKCAIVMAAINGYYRRDRIAPYNMTAAQSHTRLQTRTGINRESGTVQEGILYNRQVFEEGMRFCGTVTFLDDELVPPFEDFIEEVGYEGLVRIGTGRTRGMGQVAIVAGPGGNQQDDFFSFTQRLDAFNKRLYEQANCFEINALRHSYFFALTLHSPLILQDELLRYKGSVCAETLKELLNVPMPEFAQIYQTASIQRVTGWQDMWGLPRTNEYAIETGSVFLFACSSPLEEEARKALFELEQQGIGKRRAEGFGRICISDQFHQEVEQR